MEPLTLPGTLDCLGPIGKYVMDAAAEAGLEKKLAYRLRLAVDEIVTNVIMHGYEEAGLSGDVTIRADSDDHGLTVVVEDRAVAFDPYSAPNPDDFDKPLEERQLGGLGVYLAIRSVDEFRYERAGDMNRNIFKVHRPVEAAS